MSWSVQFIGQPVKVAEALTAQSATLSGQSKEEFDAALPHLTALVNQNFDVANPASCVIKLAANGHGYATNGTMQQSSVTVSIERLYGVIV